MIVLSWNVKGLNNGPQQKFVRELVKNHFLDVLFLQETKLFVESMIGMLPKLWEQGDC